MVLNFGFSINRFCQGTYEMGIVGELVDNGLAGCSSGVAFRQRKKLRKRDYEVCLNKRYSTSNRFLG